MASKSSSNVPLFIVFSMLCCTHVNGKLEIALLPTTEFDAAADYAGLMFFKVASPATTNQNCSASCSRCTAPGTGWAAPMECGGDLSLDLSAHSEVEISFSAPSGYEVQIDGPDRSRIEFQATVDCGGGSPYKYQEMNGATFTPVVVGTNVSSLTYNAGSSFVLLGRCSGCAKCEVYTRVQFDGPINAARFSKISWTVAYASNNTLVGSQTYRYGTDLYCWIRGATLARRLQDAGEGQGSAPRQLKVAFAGNEYKLIPLSQATTTTVKQATSTTQRSMLFGGAFPSIGALGAALLL